MYVMILYTPDTTVKRVFGPYRSRYEAIEDGEALLRNPHAYGWVGEISTFGWYYQTAELRLTQNTIIQKS